MSENLGQQVIIENVGGAGGMTGSVRVAQAPPDGYTMVLGSVGTHAQNQTLFKKPLYDAATDFTPGRPGGRDPDRPHHPQGPAAEQFQGIRRLREGQPGHHAIRLGRRRLGHASGLRGAQLCDRGQHHPRSLSGTGPAMQDLAGGRIDYLCDIIATAKPQIDAGTVKGLAIMTKERAAVLPNLPTTLEQGTDVQAYTWSAVFLPKGAPDAIVQKLNGAIVGAISTPSCRSVSAVLVRRRRAMNAPAISRPIRQERDRQMGSADQGERRPS